MIVRPFDSRDDYIAMIDYYHGLADWQMLLMGIDQSRLPSRESWLESAWRDHALPETDPGRDRFYLAWMLDGEQVGHSSINQIQWGKQASAHLHLWRPDLRKAGIGSQFFRHSISTYFSRFDLKLVVVEPHAENPAPNRVLEKLGFQFVKRYRCVPGPFNLEQDVNRYEVERGHWEALDVL